MKQIVMAALQLLIEMTIFLILFFSLTLFLKALFKLIIIGSAPSKNYVQSYTQNAPALFFTMPLVVKQKKKKKE